MLSVYIADSYQFTSRSSVTTLLPLLSALLNTLIVTFGIRESVLSNAPMDVCERRMVTFNVDMAQGKSTRSCTDVPMAMSGKLNAVMIVSHALTDQ